MEPERFFVVFFSRGQNGAIWGVRRLMGRVVGVVGLMASNPFQIGFKRL